MTSFQHLESINLIALEKIELPHVGTFAVMELSRVFTALMQCPSLRQLELNDCFILRTADVALLARFPALECFHAYSVRVESLDPLSAAPAIHTLVLWCCRDHRTGNPINIRPLIPRMPLVRSLIIQDELDEEDGVRPSPHELEPFNVELFKRLPSLDPETGFWECN